MKKLVLFPFTVLLLGVTAFAQDNTQSARMVGETFINPKRMKDRPLGSQYFEAEFAPANVAVLNIKASMRYNVYKDEFEFISPKKDTLILDKIADFKTIVFTNQNKKYELLTYTNDSDNLTTGYLIALDTKGAFTLYKKENITFYKEKIAKTTLEKDMPAKYAKTETVYYLKNANGIVAFPTSKKRLVKLYPEKKEAIETFIKDKAISFREETDLIKIVAFLATL